MRRPHAGLLLGLTLCAGMTAAQEAPQVQAAQPVRTAPAADVAPSANREGVVHVNALKNPEMHAYRAIAAGLDTFDERHALAPAVPQLRFIVRARDNGALGADVPTARLSADDFTLPLALDAGALFTVPRSQQAWDAEAELVLSRKRHDVRIWPWVRTPGLADDRVRLGDVRLECRVFITIAKKEAPFWAVALGNTVFMTGDWCSWFKDQDRSWDAVTPTSAPLNAAVLRDGDRTLALHVKGRRFDLPIGDTSWSDDALVELDYAAAPATPAAGSATIDVRTGAAGVQP